MSVVSIFGPLGNFAHVLFSTTSAITAGAMEIYRDGHYGSLESSGAVKCLGSPCQLGGVWGDGQFGVDLVAIILNALVFLVILYYARVNYRISSSGWRWTAFVMMVGSALAIASSGYSIYISDNFGSLQADGRFGSTCPVGGPCVSLSGYERNVAFGLSIGSIAMNGLALLMYYNSSKAYEVVEPISRW